MQVMANSSQDSQKQQKTVTMIPVSQSPSMSWSVISTGNSLDVVKMKNFMDLSVLCLPMSPQTSADLCVTKLFLESSYTVLWGMHRVPHSTPPLEEEEERIQGRKTFGRKKNK